MRKRSIVTKDKASGDSKTGEKTVKEIMVINDDPGVETRIAILENGQIILDEEKLVSKKHKYKVEDIFLLKKKLTNSKLNSMRKIF